MAVASLVCGFARAQDTFVLSADRAFGISARKVTARTIAVDFSIAPGCILYREKFSFTANDPKVKLVKAVFPPPVVKYDKVFERDVGYYSDRVSIQFEVQGDAVPFRLTVVAQGCAVEQGVCYPPITKDFQVPAINQKEGKS